MPVKVTFNADDFDNLLAFQVKEILPSKTVEGKEYNDVMVVEAERKMVVNGNLRSINYFTHYYYAPGTGLILTTLTMSGNVTDGQGLVNCSLN